MLYKNILVVTIFRSPAELVKDHHMGHTNVQSLFSISCMQFFPKRMRSWGLWEGLEHMVESDEGRDSLHTVVGEPPFLLGADLLLWLSPMLLPIAPYPQLLRKPNKLTSPLMNFGGIVSWFVIRTLGGGGH